MSSFFPDAVISWNNIITHFGIHDPLGFRYLLQLRVGLTFFHFLFLCMCDRLMSVSHFTCFLENDLRYLKEYSTLISCRFEKL
jgi:hypothetical protein